jgi:hypothetical protein
MLIDMATIFFLVAGTLLLWLNLRRRPSDVILTKFDDCLQSGIDRTRAESRDRRRVDLK